LYCPHCQRNCGNEASRCDACGAALVDPAPDGIEPEDELVELCRTPDAGLLLVIKSVLDSAGVPYLVQGEAALGLTTGFFHPEAYSAIVRVHSADLPDARALLESGGAPPDSEI
jgi:hypothetical protein